MVNSACLSGCELGDAAGFCCQVVLVGCARVGGVRECVQAARAYASLSWLSMRVPRRDLLLGRPSLLSLVHFTRRHSVSLPLRFPGNTSPGSQALPPDWAGENPGLFGSSSLPTVTTNQPTDGMNCNTYFYDPLVSFSVLVPWYGMRACMHACVRCFELLFVPSRVSSSPPSLPLLLAGLLCPRRSLCYSLPYTAGPGAP